jgi:hypothetical protein
VFFSKISTTTSTKPRFYKLSRLVRVFFENKFLRRLRRSPVFIKFLRRRSPVFIKFYAPTKPVFIKFLRRSPVFFISPTTEVRVSFYPKKIKVRRPKFGAVFLLSPGFFLILLRGKERVSRRPPDTPTHKKNDGTRFFFGVFSRRLLAVVVDIQAS